MTASAQAGPIADAITNITTAFFDFRNAAVYGGCDGQVSCTVGEPNANGRLITIETVNGSTLTHNGLDGFGIDSGEADEIDGGELLRFTIDDGWNLIDFGITDLFGAPDGQGPDGENGSAEAFLNGQVVPVATFGFAGINSDQANGEQVVDTDIIMDFIEFFVPARGTGADNEEFSVAFFGGRSIQRIPEPTTLALFGAGLLALGAMRRRRNRVV